MLSKLAEYASRLGGDRRKDFGARSAVYRTPRHARCQAGIRHHFSLTRGQAKRMFRGPRASLAPLLVFVLAMAAPARAGGGPENTLVVVNGLSWASRTIANHYVDLRHIPPANVVEVDWHGDLHTTKVDLFRQEILQPVFEAMERRKLTNQIDYIVYSSDFPWQIDVTENLHGQTVPSQLSPLASLTGATYLSEFVLAKSPEIVSLQSNQYMRSLGQRQTTIPTHGFRSWYGWGAGGELLENGGRRYYLSAVLAVTSGRGNSVKEALSYLGRSASADGTTPKGSIYYHATSDVRSTTRQWGFDAAVQALKRQGVRAEVVSTVIPVGKSDVMGATMGVNFFNWPTGKSQLRPGAFCDNLTSTAGMFREFDGQTPITEFLRYGAAGASGAVNEPYSIQEKFPTPDIHVHYARGCSLAEAFYQSVFGPYQLILVGDPLCQPWAVAPKVTVAGVTPDAEISGKVALTPTAETNAPLGVDRFELYVDGKLTDRIAAGGSFQLDTRPLGDGEHELRVVAIESGPIETQGRAIIPVRVKNGAHSVKVVSAPRAARLGKKFVVKVESPGAKSIALLHNGRVVGRINGESGQATLGTHTLGLGPARVDVVAMRGASRSAVGSPIRVDVVAPEPMPALAVREKFLAPGLRLTRADGEIGSVAETRDDAWLTSAGVKPGDEFTVDGYFQATADDVYQLQLYHNGPLKIEVNDVKIYELGESLSFPVLLPVSLKRGWHHLSVTGTAAAIPVVRIAFGGAGTHSIGAPVFRQMAPQAAPGAERSEK